MNKKKILIAIIVIGIVGAFVAYKMYNKPHVNVAQTSADFKITANKIINDFSSDENSANTKYLEKIIEVSGTISEVKTENGKGIISLKTNDEFGNILCHLTQEESTKITSLKEGQAITVKGICTGYLMDVILVKCVLTK